MGHKIAEAIIENGQIKYIDKKLPGGRVKVHLIYDTEEEPASKNETAKIIRETAGLYPNVDVKLEAQKLRAEWERNIGI